MKTTSPSVVVNNTELFERFALGDNTAFEQIYMQWFSPIFYLLKRLTGSEQDAQDITQDVFSRLWEKRGTIDPGRGVKSYLFSAARNSAINLYGRHRAAGNYLSEADLSDRDNVTSFDLAVAREMELLTEYMIERMPEQRRRVYELSYRKGLSPAEIATALGLAPRVVHDHLYQARCSIKEMLPEIILLLMSMNS